MSATCLSVPAPRTAVPSGLVLPLCGDRAGGHYRTTVPVRLVPAVTPSPLARLLTHSAIGLN